MIISSNNEWGKLKSVVVGSASHANWPSDDPVFAREHEKTTWKKTPVPKGPVPQSIVDEANEDLDKLANTLRHLGVNVHRPYEMNFVERKGMYNYCPRDRLLILGNKVVDCNMMYPCRNQEIEALDFVIKSADEVIQIPRNEDMILDAANVCRVNNTLLYLQSPSGNMRAASFLRKQFPQYTIELCRFYSGVHIDSTVVPLREGFVVLNASRVNEKNCPEVFKGWEKLWVHDVVKTNFYQYPYASKWIGLNMLSIDEKTVIIDKNQTDLILQLEQKGFTIIPLELRHARTLGGGFHCTTLDLHRE